jgi:hypothetical protein
LQSLITGSSHDSLSRRSSCVPVKARRSTAFSWVSGIGVEGVLHIGVVFNSGATIPSDTNAKWVFHAQQFRASVVESHGSLPRTSSWVSDKARSISFSWGSGVGIERALHSGVVTDAVVTNASFYLSERSLSLPAGLLGVCS